MGGHPHQQTSTSQAGGDRLEAETDVLCRWLNDGLLGVSAVVHNGLENRLRSMNQSQREAMSLDCCKGLHVCVYYCIKDNKIAAKLGSRRRALGAPGHGR